MMKLELKLKFKSLNKIVQFEVFTGVAKKTSIFWDKSV